MSHAVNLHSADGIIATIPGEGAMLVVGDTVPSDGAAGYGDSCVFLQTDGGAGTGLYLNEGSNTSADFNALVSGAELAYLSGVTAGTALADKALVLNSSKGISTITSATITTLTTSGIVRTGYITQIGMGAKVGATAGFVVAAGDNLPYVATLPQSQSGSTLVIPIFGLHIGDTITGFRVVAQIESAGGTVTIDGDLRAVTNVAADPTDASIGTMTQVSVTADTAVSQSKTGLTEVVASGKTYYLKLTATTAGSTDIIVQACEITVTQS